MIPFSLSELCQHVDGQLIGQDMTIKEINTDSRKVIRDSLFIALRGESFDGHDFITGIEKKGATAVLVEKPCDTSLPQLVVKDTRLGLGRIGYFNRQRTKAKFVGLTGSSGKTTVKEMIRSVLEQQGKTLATDGNFNNDIGVPLTLLRLQGDEDFAVIEMGANHQGEISYTSRLTEPDIALITNIGPAHLEGFGGMDGVAKAKSEIFSGLKPNGIAVLNQDSDFFDFLSQQVKQKQQKQVSFSLESKADYSAENISFDNKGCAQFDMLTPHGNIMLKLTIPGRHNVANALATAAIADNLQIKLSYIKAGLEKMEPVAGRLLTSTGINQSVIIDDSYNANYASVNAAIEYLASLPGKHILVFGDMAELGADAKEYHSRVGERCKQLKIDKLYTIGELSAYASQAFDKSGLGHFQSRQQLIEQLKQETGPKVNILIKGSRSARMEDIVSALRFAAEPMKHSGEEG